MHNHAAKKGPRVVQTLMVRLCMAACITSMHVDEFVFHISLEKLVFLYTKRSYVLLVQLLRGLPTMRLEISYGYGVFSEECVLVGDRLAELLQYERGIYVACLYVLRKRFYVFSCCVAWVYNRIRLFKNLFVRVRTFDISRFDLKDPTKSLQLESIQITKSSR